jgi:aminopeptidase N
MAATPTPTVPAGSQVEATATPLAEATPAPTATAASPGSVATQAPPADGQGAAQQPTHGCPAATMPQVTLESIGDPYFPELGNSGYEAQHYTLDLTVDMAANTISGTATIKALALQQLARFNLDFTGLTISSVSVNDKPAEHSRRGHELTITPVEALAGNDEFTVAVAYSGEPVGLSEGDKPFEIGWSRYDGGVFVASEPSGAASWYPVNDHPCDKATYTFRITVAKPYMVAANGTLKETIDNGDTATYVWESSNTMASYLTTLGISEFVREEQEGPNGLPIRNYFETEQASDATDDFEQTPRMIEFFNSIFGPYPFEAYGVYLVNYDTGFALETQTLSLFGRQHLNEPNRTPEIVAHELAHQWFGNSVSLERWQDIWLNEGFATYAQLLWMEHERGEEYLDFRVRDSYQTIANGEFPPPGKPPADDLFSPSVYLRGGLTLHALRLKVGDEAFTNTLKTYAERYKYGNATTQEFIAVAEEVTGQQLDDFFSAWLYEEKIPDIAEMGLSDE